MIYKDGKSNIVADALSRRVDHSEAQQLNEISKFNCPTDSKLMKSIQSAQLTDEQCKPLLNSQLTPPDSQLNLSVRDGVVYRHDKLFIPSNSAVKQSILHQYHDHPLAGHTGTDKTIELIKRDCYWVNNSSIQGVEMLFRRSKVHCYN